MTLTDCKPGTYVRCDRFRGVACYVRRLHTEPESIDGWDDEEIETGNIVIRMVGDDRDHIVDPDDCTPIDDDDYCGSCGQLGCGWGH